MSKKFKKPQLENLISDCLSQILLEVSDSYPDELNVYDFDDTLISTSGTIHLLNNETGARREMHPHEFHEYDLKSNEEFDLSDFVKLVKPRKLPYFKKLQSDYARLGPHGVSICTARPDANPIIDLMAKHGMADIEIVAVGDPAPKGKVSEINGVRKKSYLKNKLVQRRLKTLRFYDDNIDNIKAAQSLIAEFPEVKFEIVIVKV